MIAPTLSTVDFLAPRVTTAFKRPYRGEIYDYANTLKLGAGYAVKGKFDINTARHLIEPLRALRNPKIRVVVIQGAVQTVKSLVSDLWVPYLIEHEPGDILWLFEDDAKAKYYAETRAMPLIRSIPSIAKMLESVHRDDKTKTKLKFSHMNLVMCGLNEGNVQSISWRYVIIDEAWMARANGLIRQAKDRTKQYPDTSKILILGQGGWADEDFDREFKDTDQRMLHYNCPSCGGSQPFELAVARPDDFPDVELRGKYAGLGWDTNDITRPNKRWNFDEVGKTAHHRCYHCDFRIEDTPDVRRRLNDSYHYVARNPGAEASRVGFQWPGEASMRVKFSDLAIKYLKAKIAKEELGYILPMQEYYMKDRGLTWSADSESEVRIVTSEDYDPAGEWKDEAYRFLIADCQKELKKFFVGVFAVAQNGEARELCREEVPSFEAIREVQLKWNVKDQRVFLDCGYQMTKVLRQCVRFGHKGWVMQGRRRVEAWLSWAGLKGSGQETFLRVNPRTELKEWRIVSERKFYDVNEGTNLRLPRAPWYEWSNLHCKDILQTRLDGTPGMPKLYTLPDKLAPDDPWSWSMQVRSERRIESFVNGKKRAIWKLISETRPDHERDKLGMLIAVMAICGIVGGINQEEDQQEAA
jgi:hypothetical protein